MAEKKKRKIDLLNQKYREFLYHYIELQNPRKAYQLVYPKTKPNSADVNASKLLKNTKVAEALQEILNEQWEKRENQISDLFKKLVNLTGSDISDYLDEEGNVKVKDFQKMNTYPITQYDQTITTTEKGQNIKQTIKLQDKQKAIDSLAKILGMIKDKPDSPLEIIILPAKRPEETKSED